MNGQKIGYIRVSSVDQNTDRQIEALNSYELDKIFTDKLSGKNVDRSSLQEMLKFIRQGDHLFVHSMDRLARNLLDLRGIINDLTTKGIKISFIKENLTFAGDDSAMSILLLSIMGSVAEFERSLIRERQAEGIKIAKTKGIYKGRKQVVKPEQIELMRQRVAEGVPKAKIARDMKICRETLYKYLSDAIPEEI